MMQKNQTKSKQQKDDETTSKCKKKCCKTWKQKHEKCCTSWSYNQRKVGLLELFGGSSRGLEARCSLSLSHLLGFLCFPCFSVAAFFFYVWMVFFVLHHLCVCAAFDPPCSSSRAVTTCVFVKRQRGRFVLISQRAELFTPASPPDSSEQLVTANGERFTAYSTREFGETWRWISAKPRQSFYIFIYIYIHSSGFYLKDMTGQPEAIAGSKERKIYEILVSRFSFCFCVCSNKANMKLQNYKNIKRSQT